MGSGERGFRWGDKKYSGGQRVEESEGGDGGKMGDELRRVGFQLVLLAGNPTVEGVE